MQTNVYQTPGFFEDIGGVFRTVSEYPARIIEFGQEQNKRIADFMQGLQDAAGGAGDQIRKTEIQTAGGQAAQWIDENKQMLTAGVVIAIIIWVLK